MAYDISSNGNLIPFLPQYFQEMEESTFLPGPLLRGKYELEGYLLFRGLLDPSEVLSIREQYFNLFDDKLFKEGSSKRDGLFSGMFQFLPHEHGLANHPASLFVKTEAFNLFTRSKILFELSELVLGAPTEILPRRPLRHFYKNTHVATKAHADFTYLDQGTPKLLSVWIPLGDVDVDGGSIIYLRRTQNFNQEELRAKLNSSNRKLKDKRPITDDLQAIADIAGEPWLYTNFKAGDIVVHSPFLIHATLDCNTDAMRLSTDLRFAVADEQHDYRWKGDWRGDDGY